MTNLLAKFENSHSFTQDEAWMLFRLAAFGEAFGWTILIIGIWLKQFVLHGNDVPVRIAGEIHGTLFIIYLVASLGLYPSLKWSRIRAIIALMASVPPFGSLLFEQWAAHNRYHQQFKILWQLNLYNLLVGVAS